MEDLQKLNCTSACFLWLLFRAWLSWSSGHSGHSVTILCMYELLQSSASSHTLEMHGIMMDLSLESAACKRNIEL